MFLVAENDFVGMDLAIQVVEKIDLFRDVFFNLHKSTNYEERLINIISKSKLEEGNKHRENMESIQECLDC